MVSPPKAPPKIGAVLFDAYGTLFDVYSVGALAEQLFPGHGERLAQLWRDKQIEYTRLITMSSAGAERYRPFWQVTRDALRWSLARLALPVTAAVEERLMNQYHHLSAFPENREVLLALRIEQKGEGVGLDVVGHGEEAYTAGDGAILIAPGDKARRSIAETMPLSDGGRA